MCTNVILHLDSFANAFANVDEDDAVVYPCDVIP